MASIPSVCDVCKEHYNDADNKPLILPCGHTYCQLCLQTCVTDGENNCSSCRCEWSGDVTDLIVNYKLMPSVNYEMSSSVTSCNEMSSSVTSCNEMSSSVTSRNEMSSSVTSCKESKVLHMFWCLTCEHMARRQCSTELHKICKLIPVDNTYTEELNETLEEMRAKIQSNKDVCQQRTEAICENLKIIRKLIKSGKKVENELVLKANEMTALNLKLSSSLNSLDERINVNGETTFKLKISASLEFGLFWYKLTKPLPELDRAEDLSLCSSTRVLKEMEITSDMADHMMKLFQSYEYFRTNDTWVIDDCAKVAGAAITIMSSNYRPTVVTFKSTEEKPLKGSLDLYPVIVNEAKSIELQLMDSFWPSNSSRSEYDDDIMVSNNLPNSQTSPKVKMFFGHLSSSSIRELKNVEELGQVMYDGNDLFSFDDLAECVRVLHFSVLNTYLKPDKILQSRCYNEMQLWLHFPNLCDDELSWMQEVVATLLSVKSEVTKRFHRLCLPRCRLTFAGMKRLLELLCEPKYTECVWIGHHSFSSVQIGLLVNIYKRDGLNLLAGPDFRETVQCSYNEPPRASITSRGLVPILITSGTIELE